MLGFNPPVEHAYEPVLTIGSLLFAVVFTVGGLHVATNATTTRGIAAGGAVIGVGISVMHFTGMAGLDIAGSMSWDWVLVVSAVVLGVTFAALATVLEVRAKSERGKWAGFICLVLAICSMHFTAMGAATFHPDPSITVSDYAFSSELIAISIVAAMSVATGISLYLIDVRSQRELLEGFRHASLHDSLTGIPNRTYLSALLPEVIAVAAEGGSEVSVIVIDLDRFKEVNDVQGHDAGDAVLKGVSSAIGDILGPGEFIARMGGDEFVAIKADVGTSGAVRDFARRIEAASTRPVKYHDRVLSVGASIGIARFPAHGRTAKELMSAADLAMYRAKKSDDDKICFYDPSVDDIHKSRTALTYELRQALERSEFELYYQPLIDVTTSRVIAFEALLRWRHPVQGLLEPAHFLPVAESAGIIAAIGKWVLQKACADATGWRNDIRVSVNVAAAQVYGVDLVKLVQDTLVSTGLSPARLEIELTEESIIGDAKKALFVMRQLKALGVSLVMDDYGTGYSSLANLRVFPFDKIKIDRTFISDVTTNPVSAAIVRSSLALARDLKIRVVAEGVEQEEHLAFLRAHGCTEAQGFLFGRPTPSPMLDEIMQEAPDGLGPTRDERATRRSKDDRERGFGSALSANAFGV